ncbi:MAG: alkaline phosphatase family protein [Dissulfurispiraceae bacterium]
MRRFTKFCLALAASALLSQAAIIPAASADQSTPTVTAQPGGDKEVSRFFNPPGSSSSLTNAQLVALLQQKIKYVFVIFNENHSFDNEYGTFPGVNGLYSDGVNPRSAANTLGYTQTYTDVNGNTVTVTPFLIGPQQNSNVVDSVDHGHNVATPANGFLNGIPIKIDAKVVNGTPQAQMDQFSYDEYNRFARSGGTANAAEGTQFARLVMSHIDCNTIPFFWQWANNFTIFDNIFATEDTPSSPNAVAMIAGQSGETQWVLHPGTNGTFSPGVTYTATATSGTTGSGTTVGTPMVGDHQPFYGSQFDPTPLATIQPKNVNDGYSNSNIEVNLTFANVLLTALGTNVTANMAQDLNPTFDTPDIQQDIPYIQAYGSTPVNWRWYQEGYDLESSDTGGTATHLAYVSHHQGPQYFGYLANNPSQRGSFKGITDFFNDMTNKTLPNGGIFYIRGGYQNQMGVKPTISNTANYTAAQISTIQAAKAGDDDHPSYTDRQLSEAMAANVINAVASNPNIWSQSLIIITYDESDGFYDHVPPRILSYGPDGYPLSRGIRIPLIMISPYAKAHSVSHVEGDHNAIIQTINTIFGLPPLASLPNEELALHLGNSTMFNQFAPAGSTFTQQYLGPRDINSTITDSLLSGFDQNRLQGITPPLSSSLASLPASVVSTFPHYGGTGCQAIGITPVLPPGQTQDFAPPAGFNPLPSTVSANN